MSETLRSAQTADQLPSLPETHPADPIIQCGVLYLGTAPNSTGLRGLDSIQQPFSHRYPVDGTNTVRGIDAVLSVYDNGIQLAFTRQQHTVIFFPINSLTYCASLRFSIIANDQTKPTSPIDWRFMPLDAVTNYDSKHPPLFAVVVQRTQILPGEECHCFITKSTDAAITLVQAISEVYANLRPGTKCLKSPIFYQLDRFGRRLSEITGVIYISPANDDDSQLTRTNRHRFTDANMLRHYLFDTSYEGFFYRTDMSIIEQWQLWDDDDDLNRSRPRPPASPFGLHEGLYHDDTTNEIQRYLRHMDDEDPSCSCTSSTSNQTSSSTASSVSTKYVRKHNRYSSSTNKPKSIDDTDEFNLSLSNLHKTSFEPIKPEKKSKKKKRPIIIEKVVPNPMLSIPILNPKLPPTPTEPVQESKIDYTKPEDSYHINEHGEKITKEGNRIVFMDVVQMNTKTPSSEIPSHKSSSIRVRSTQHRVSNRIPIPMIDMRSIERLFNEENTKTQRRLSLNVDVRSPLKTPDPLESNDKNQRKTSVVSSTHSSKNESHRHRPAVITGGPTINYVERSFTPLHPPNSITSPTHSSKNEHHHRHHHSTVTPGSPAVNYVERPFTASHSSTPIVPPTPPMLTDAKLNEYISNIYGTAGSVKSTSSSTTNRGSKSSTVVVNSAFISPFRYMQSSMNRNILEEYRNAY